MAISVSVGLERISRVVGYTITKGVFSNTTPNLPQRVAILAEGSRANQLTLDLTPTAITSIEQAGLLYGFGSPIYNIMRILRPVNSSGIGGIPTIVYPQLEPVGAIEAQRDVTPVGVATGNATHTLIINGRDGVDGGNYDVQIVEGDNDVAISTKIVDVINGVLAAPCTAALNVNIAEVTAKWRGLTSEDLNITVNTNGNPVGITYGVVSNTVGIGTPDINPALNLFMNDWNTIVINSYGEVVLNDLEAFNGIPDPTTPTGRYEGIIFKPFIALYGDVTTDPSIITDPREVEVTNAVCPAPNSTAFPMEAAANMARLFARVTNDTPHLDVNALSYPDMPVPTDGNIGSMSDYDFRDSIVKLGSSTVDLIAGRYQVQDFVTTYHPVGEVPPQFRYCRNLMLDFNVRFGYFLLEQINLVDHAIANDGDIVSVSNVIKPKQWKQIVDAYANDLSSRALIADASFMQDSILVEISGVNPDRLETFFRYKRTGVARISSTTAEAGFNFGEV